LTGADARLRTAANKLSASASDRSDGVILQFSAILGQMLIQCSTTRGNAYHRAETTSALRQGDRVALTVRRPAELREWADEHGDRVLVLPLDVTDGEQVRIAVKTAEDRFGGIDVLVNNAGRGWYGSVEGTVDETVRRTFDLNFFAVVDVIRAVLPGMRAR